MFPRLVRETALNDTNYVLLKDNIHHVYHTDDYITYMFQLFLNHCSSLAAYYAQHNQGRIQDLKKEGAQGARGRVLGHI